VVVVAADVGCKVAEVWKQYLNSGGNSSTAVAAAGVYSNGRSQEDKQYLLAVVAFVSSSNHST